MPPDYRKISFYFKKKKFNFKKETSFSFLNPPQKSFLVGLFSKSFLFFWKKEVF